MQNSHQHSKTARIRQLNDHFRRTFIGGAVMVTSGIEALSCELRAEVLRRVRAFDCFENNNDPHREHDFGSFDMPGQTIFWKIDYYDRAVALGSDDPADATKTTRVLTVMLASEY